VCVCKRERERGGGRKKHSSAFYIFMCVSVCGEEKTKKGEWGEERERERSGGERERDRLSSEVLSVCEEEETKEGE